MIADRGDTVERNQRRFVMHRARAKRAPRVGFDVERRARELLIMASHDLRSPLTAIKMIAHHISRRWQAGEEPTGAEWAAVVSGISRAADEAFGMIDDLLAIERLQNRRGPALRPARVEIGAVIEKAIACEQEALERARCKVTTFQQRGLDRARGPWDPAYLLRVFGNLLRNAANHAPGSPVRITLARRDDRLRVVFADRGPGLPRLSPGGVAGRRFPDDGGGAAIHGFGLWIVRRAVARLGGRLQIHSRAGRGFRRRASGA